MAAAAAVEVLSVCQVLACWCERGCDEGGTGWLTTLSIHNDISYLSYSQAVRFWRPKIVKLPPVTKRSNG